MVFFTCNHCGESVKKPSVDKHYNTKCRGAPKSVSCMDCQKDFQDNYVEHVKCITEMEKYSGKDYVPKESANSGAKKQEGWVETVRAVLDSSEYQLSKVTRQAFEMLQKYDNVPRKKAKFLNFVTNSVRIPRKTVEDVWDILEKEQEKLKQNKQKQLEAAKQAKENKQNGIKAQEEETLQQNGHEDEAGDDTEAKQKKKKNKKSKKEHETAAEQTTAASTAKVLEINGDDGIKKKKKKKHTETEDLTQNEAAVVHDENSEKKNKKSKPSKEAEEATAAPQENGHKEKTKKKKRAADDVVETIEPETASKKLKQNGHDENLPMENGVEATVKKVKKRTLSEQESNEQATATKQQKQSDALQNDAAANEPYLFCWEFELTKIIGKHDDGIQIDKLKKKILKKYTQKFDEALNDRQMHGFERKFTKKIYKNKQFKVEGDIVKSAS